MLKERFRPEYFKEQFFPFPDIDNRAFWDSLPERDMYIKSAVEDMEGSVPALPASLYRAAFETGDRVGFETPYFLRRRILTTLMIAECMENKGRFTDTLTDYIALICEELSWSIPAHTINGTDALPDVTDPVVELFSAETAAMLAVCVQVMAPRLTGSIRLLVKAVNQKIIDRILRPYLRHEHYSWLNGVSNWNAWINSNILYSAMLCECDGELRAAVAEKAFGSLDSFITGYPADGGCDEGPTYWTVAAAACMSFCSWFMRLPTGLSVFMASR